MIMFRPCLFVRDGVSALLSLGALSTSHAGLVVGEGVSDEIRRSESASRSLSNVCVGVDVCSISLTGVVFCVVSWLPFYSCSSSLVSICVLLRSSEQGSSFSLPCMPSFSSELSSSTDCLFAMCWTVE